MRTQGEIEASICDGISRFEQDYMGRGPKDIHAGRRRRCSRRQRVPSLLRSPPLGPPPHTHPRHGLLHLQQRRGSGGLPNLSGATGGLPASVPSKIQDLLYASKRPFSYRIKQLLTEQHDPLLAQLTIRERPGKFTFRFWQEGPGYDRNLTSLQSLHDAIDYLHHNPVRRRLCDSPDQWKWSSWHPHHNPAFSPTPDFPAVDLHLP